MTTVPIEPQPTLDLEGWITFVAKAYFSPLETGEARLILQGGGSYDEALAYLVEQGQDMRKTPIYTTVPNGKVLVAKPGRPADSLAYIPIPLMEVARRAFPCPKAYESQVGEEQSGGFTPTGRVQLAFWEESELIGGNQQEGSTGPTSNDHRAAPPQRKGARPKKLHYIEQPVAKIHCEPRPGWVVKDRGLGYTVEPMRTRSGYLVSLIHLKSRREMASVVCDSLDHERIREWVSACVLLTDWTKGIGTLLKEQQGEQKQRAWTRQLEALWYQQKFTVKRQLSFF